MVYQVSRSVRHCCHCQQSEERAAPSVLLPAAGTGIMNKSQQLSLEYSLTGIRNTLHLESLVYPKFCFVQILHRTPVEGRSVNPISCLFAPSGESTRASAPPGCLSSRVVSLPSIIGFAAACALKSIVMSLSS